MLQPSWTLSLWYIAFARTQAHLEPEKTTFNYYVQEAIGILLWKTPKHAKDEHNFKSVLKNTDSFQGSGHQTVRLAIKSTLDGANLCKFRVQGFYVQ